MDVGRRGKVRDSDQNGRETTQYPGTFLTDEAGGGDRLKSGDTMRAGINRHGVEAERVLRGRQ